MPYRRFVPLGRVDSRLILDLGEVELRFAWLGETGQDGVEVSLPW